jgi:hypothetical protein
VAAHVSRAELLAEMREIVGCIRGYHFGDALSRLEALILDVDRSPVFEVVRFAGGGSRRPDIRLLTPAERSSIVGDTEGGEP